MAWLLKSYIAFPLGVRGLLLRVACLAWINTLSFVWAQAPANLGAHSYYNCAQEKCVQGMQVPLNPESQ